MKKSIYSLPALIGLMWASNQRYLKFISCVDDPTVALNPTSWLLIVLGGKLGYF
jgi:hypothetical protein